MFRGQSMSKELIFHVGLGKTGSSYLQQAFFPKLHGVKYIQTRRFHKFEKDLDRAPDGKFFLSREFDQQLERESVRISNYDKDAKIIVVFRPQAPWIGSQYKRFTKNGMHETFDEFFDIDNDQGLWKQDELYWMKKIEIIEKYFTQKPLVLFQEDLKEEPYKFFDDIANYMGARYNKDEISLESIHKARTDKQLKMMRKFGTIFFKKNQVLSENYFINRFQSRIRQFKTLTVIFSSVFFPGSYFDDIELLPKEQLKKIAEHYADDYAEVRAYARENNPTY